MQKKKKKYKSCKRFCKKNHFKDIKFPVKIRDIHKIKKKKESYQHIKISVFGFENKGKHPIYLSNKKCCEGKHVDLLLIGKEGRKHFVLIKNFNALVYDDTLNRGIFVVIVYKLLVQKKY